MDEGSTLNTAALTSLLEELQRHPESCHFNKPVSKKLVRKRERECVEMV